MKKQILAALGLILLGVAIAALVSAAFVVDETEQVVITQFGRPVGEPITEPGLKFKTPFIQELHAFDKRFLEWNGDVNQIPTKDKRFIWVDTYARWRIIDPLLFYQRLRNEDGAQSRLDDIIDGETRNAVANHDLLQLVRSSNREPTVDPIIEDESAATLEPVDIGRPAIMEGMLTKVSKRTADLGIEVIDVRFKRIDYNQNVRRKVYERMIAERQRIAELYRSEGQGEAAEIRGKKERELKRIESEAFEAAQGIRGTADAEATAIYAEAYSADPAFYQFLRTMEAYPQVLDEDSWLILSTQTPFFRFLESTGETGAPAGERLELPSPELAPAR
ncbi:MAG: protease modulator HflC [Myxococcota bacterium]